MSTSSQGQIEEYDQFKSDAKGQHDYWDAELKACFDAQRKWHKRGEGTVNRFLDKRGAGEEDWFRLNLFYSNITTLRSMLFGKLPEVEIKRQNEDFNDDVARVASVILKRMLNADIGTPNDEYSDSLRMNLDDRLMPGLGVSRVRYTFEKETRETAAQVSLEGVVMAEGFSEDIIVDEKAPLQYVHWRDFGWSPARTWSEVRWVAFKARMTRDELIERFGEKIGKAIPLTESSQAKEENQWTEKDDPKQDAWSRAAIWEIWDSAEKKVIWWCKDHGKILDTKDDPLGLVGFFPIPKPMIANVTTTAFMPVPDFTQAQDLYNEVDKLETRISLITEAVKVVGVYDKSAKDVQRMMIEGVENDLIPVDNWAMFAEKGGLKGLIDWLPFENIAGVLNQLVERRNDVKAQLFEITGMSDIMRGAQAAGGAVSATERALEARFASVRIQSLQDEFANYATDLIRLRAEIIVKHFSPEQIVKQSNIEQTPDAQLAGPAIEFLKSGNDLVWRIEVKPESVAMVDYAQLKSERTEYINALAVFLQSAAPLAEQDPAAMPFLLEMLKWGLAGFKGSENIEGVLDQAIQTMQQNQQNQGQEPEKPSPEEIKAQADQQMEQMKQQGEQMKLQGNIQLEQVKNQSRMGQIQAEGEVRTKELQMETQQDVIKEKSQMDANMREESHETEEFIKREKFKADEAIRVERARTNIKVLAND